MSSSIPSIPHTIPLPGGIPSTHTPHTEGTTTILLPKANTAFLNPVQQYNRDLSVAVIRAWNEMRKEEAEVKWLKKLEGRPDLVERKREKARRKRERKLAEEGREGLGNGKEDATDKDVTDAAEIEPVAGPSQPATFRAQQITILEALSATGLRAIRYAKEIPDVKYVLANDISPSACEAMRQNVAFNGVGENVKRRYNGPAASGAEIAGEKAAEDGDVAGPSFIEDGPVSTEEEEEMKQTGRRPDCRGRVKVNEGDACALMYARRAPSARVDVVDLDPYGTAAPFIDAAIGCIADGGLLAVTCTDLAVLAGSQYPEKSFSNYGGACVNAEYSHEVALRLVLSSLAQTAARYGRYITPLLSFSIDFYVRLFVRVDTQPLKVKSLNSQIGVVYVCGYCQTPTPQPFGRIIDKEAKNGSVNRQYKTAPGPPNGGTTCEQCGGTQHLGGPMWLSPIHDTSFAERVIKSIEGQQADYRTWPRIQGMLTMAKDELPDAFYFTPNKINGMFHSSSGPSQQLISALLNGGYNVSRSHAISGSIKTNAPRTYIYDIIREVIKSNPVRMDKISEGSPARRLLSTPITNTIDLTPHLGAKRFDKSDKMVRYQVNPEANWGPGTRAKMIQNQNLSQGKGKRKGEESASDVAAGEVKRARGDVGEEGEGGEAGGEEVMGETVEEEAAFNA